MQICRSEDGQVFEVNITLLDIERFVLEAECGVRMTI